MKTKEEYGDKFGDHLLAQYELLRNTINHTTDDRNAQVRFVLTILVALAAGMAFLFANSFGEGRSPWIFAGPALMFSIVGVGASLYLRLYLHVCNRAISAKYRLLREYEEHLPDAMFSREWDLRGGRAASAITVQAMNWVIVLFALMAFSIAIYAGWLLRVTVFP